MILIKLALLIITTLLSVATAVEITIGSFNVESFGMDASMNKLIRGAVAKVICEMDVIGIQEFRREMAATKVLEDVHERCSAKRMTLYMNDFSGNSGAHKEIYVFYYDTNKIRVIYCETFKTEKMIRPPYICVFEVLKDGSRFVYINVHSNAKPDLAVVEADQLFEIYSEIMRLFVHVFQVNFGFVGGDLKYVNLPNLVVAWWI
jgi:hypothetical protein